MIRGFRSFHPFVLLSYYVLAIIAIMLYQHPVFLLIAALLITFLNLLLDGGRELLKWGWMLVIMCTFILILTPVFNRRGNHILFYYFDNPVMLEAMIQGIIIALTLFNIISIFVTFNMVITPEKFLFLFSKWFPKWALLTMLSIRFVPLLRRKLVEIDQIQRLKGLSLKSGSVKNRLKNGMSLIQMLLTWSLEESIQTADSMSARGYGLIKRSKYQPYVMKKRDLVALLYLVGLSVVVIIGWKHGHGVLTLHPTLERISLKGIEWFYLVIWLFFIGFPVCAEGKEVIKWKYYQQKI